MNSATQHLIIGSTGKTGSRVIAGLKAHGFKSKGASRHGEVHFDWDDPTSWSAALDGIDKVYLTYYPDLAIAKAPEDISRFCALAKMKGIKHITLLSGRSEPAAQICENIVIQSGINWTVVRAAWFDQNFSEGLFRQFIIDGNIALPVTDVTDIVEFGISVAEAAKHLDVSRSTLNRLINQESSVSPAMAYRLSIVFGMDPESWLRMQSFYDLWEVKKSLNSKKIKPIIGHSE